MTDDTTPRRRRRERPVLSTPVRTVAVVGASLAGLSAVEALRNLGYDGRIVVFGGEDGLPYDRPPLSKQVLAGKADPERTALRSPAAIDRLAVEWVLGRRATGLDLERRTVAVDGDGAPVTFDGLVIATGATPRRLPHTPALSGIHVLRTLDDCLALRAELDRGPRVAVVGAGFIGAEVAATARGRGLEVDLVEAFPTPLANSLGAEAGAWCGQLHVDHGVRLHCGVAVTGFEGTGRVEALHLSDGRVLAADVVVIGAGVVPETSWLEGSGLAVDNGVVCDEYCRAAPGVVAAGDVARWFNPLFGEAMRVEHWTNAVEQGEAAARNLVVPEPERVPYAPVPYFWSDQYEVKIQFSGRAWPDDELRVVHGSVADREFVAVFARHGRLTGVLAFNCGREFAAYQRLISKRADLEEALAATPS